MFDIKEKCDWCGREFKQGIFSGRDLFGRIYCSDKCKHEAKQAKKKG